MRGNGDMRYEVRVEVRCEVMNEVTCEVSKIVGLQWGLSEV